MTESEPSSFRRCFGLQVRTLREFHERSRDDVGRPCGVSGSMIGAVERADRIPDERLIRNLDKTLGANGLLASAVDYMEAEQYREFFRDFAVYERKCQAVSAYAPLAIPGLLQTEEYARATFRTFSPALEEKDIETQVAARLKRQQLLERSPKPWLSFVIEESVLHRPLGGRPALKRQLLRLLEAAPLPFVTLQVMRTAVEEHAGLHGYLSLVITTEHQHLAYIEHQNGNELIREKRKVGLYVERYGMLRSQALSPPESASLIEKLAGEL